MFSVEDILKTKGNEVYTATPDMPIQEALQIMADKNLGALVVIEGEQVVGIFSERDLARRIIGKDACSLATKVKQIMTSPVTTVSPSTPIEECMALMTDKHIRHLPVIENDRLVGVISIGDVVKGILTNREALIDQLKDYISGTGYGR
jgi:CBS domain-containing protein